MRAARAGVIEALDDDGASEEMGEHGRVLRARLATGGSQAFFVITDPEACAAAVRAARAYDSSRRADRMPSCDFQAHSDDFRQRAQRSASKLVIRAGP